MSNLDEDEENLAQFLESEILSEVSDQDEDENELERPMKRARATDISSNDKNDFNDGEGEGEGDGDCESKADRMIVKRIETGILSKIPPELFPHILKFLSSEDLFSCSRVCKFLSFAASDESLWRRLYWLRWGLLPPTKRLRDCAWKKLYIQRDEEDIIQSVRNCPPEFKEYYLQMYAAKRSQAPLRSQVNDDLIILDKTVADQVSMWKSSKGLSDKVVTDHTCSGEVCSYYQIGNVFICEKTGNVHVCDDTCKEVIADPANELLVCTISGHCFDRLLSPSEMDGDAEQDLLSHINHRNIVKLLGCCLETQVPLLVYEFIPNGTLSKYIHNPSEDFPITWEMRLQIAIDVAGALTYLHSASSTPIFHRDIKTSNILLAKYRAKLSDFGTSRLVAVDQTHLTTRVQGTFGYLDPEYFQSHQFTEKGDVYDFGVVLLELLTGKRAVLPTESHNGKSLVSWFLSTMEWQPVRNFGC